MKLLYQEIFLQLLILLLPQYSDIKSRSEVTLSSKISEGIELRVPIIASPMDTVCGTTMSKKMAEFGGLGIIHRYNSIDKQVAMVSEASDDGNKTVGAAIGITGDYLHRARELISAGASVLCLRTAATCEPLSCLSLSLGHSPQSGLSPDGHPTG